VQWEQHTHGAMWSEQRPTSGAQAAGAPIYMPRLTTLKPRVQMLSTHAAKQGGWVATRRTSRHERGYGTAWDRIREQIMVRDFGLCQVCKRAGRLTFAHAVDHIVPKFEGGDDNERNLEAICKPCHQAKTENESARGRGG
jgi:5-methylcytosine-specific restriction protein A